jgi:hypothetical protein
MKIEETEGEYRQVYKMSCTEYDGDREMVKLTQKFDGTDFNLQEVLGVVEDFLINSGYDWLEPGSLTYKSSTPNLEEYGLFNNKDEKSEDVDVKRDENIKAFERMSGIDRTAKVVHIGDHKKPEAVPSPVSLEFTELDQETMDWLDKIGRAETGREPFEHLLVDDSNRLTIDEPSDSNFEVVFSSDPDHPGSVEYPYDQATNYNYSFKDFNVDFGKHEYNVDADDNIIEDNKP